MSLSFLAIYVSVLCAFFQPSHSFTDPRDGAEYEVVKVGASWWFNDNLRYESDLCFCQGKKRQKKQCIDANFYSNKELDNVCPSGWRAATKTDWNNYLTWLLKQRNLTLEMMQLDTLPAPNSTLMLKDTTGLLQLFSEANLLKIKPLGWVQGKRIKNLNTMTFWANNQELADNRFHVHISNDGIFRHTHDHNIIDKPHKTRRFAVRCVCDDDALIDELP